MAKNLMIESTDSKAEREMAAFAPYINSVSVTVTAARQPSGARMAEQKPPSLMSRRVRRSCLAAS